MLVADDNLPDTVAFRQGEAEDESSQDAQHRPSPADEQSRSQLEPEGKTQYMIL